MSKIDSKSSNNQRIFRQVCKFCSGDHWNDNYQAYPTVEERKQVVKRLGSCYACLKRGHRVFECFTKKTCYFCKGKIITTEVFVTGMSISILFH